MEGKYDYDDGKVKAGGWGVAMRAAKLSDVFDGSLPNKNQLRSHFNDMKKRYQLEKLLREH